jgi:uncharacterized protein YdhG (YjbR/CyaY superfamily)
MTIQEYLDHVPEDKKEAFHQLRHTIKEHIPKGFEECMSYNMIGYVVPHSTFPEGYHCDPKQPLPFVSIAAQKNHIGLYHMGIYANKPIEDWFRAEYPNHVKTKLDMGKSCIRFKNPKKIPFDLIAQLMTKISVEEWIETYKKAIKR